MSCFLVCWELRELGLGHTSVCHTGQSCFSEWGSWYTLMVTSDSPLAEQDIQEDGDSGSTHYEQGCTCYWRMLWERQIPGKFLSYLQAVVLSGIRCTQLPSPGQPWPLTTALMWSCLWSRPRENWKGLLGDNRDEHHLHKAGTSAFPAGLCRWQINEDGLMGLSLMRFWRWRVYRWKKKYFKHHSCSFNSSRSLWNRRMREDVGDQGSQNP